MGFSCLRGWYSTARHSDLGIYPGGPFGKSEAKFNLSHQFVPRFAHWTVEHVELDEFPWNPSLPETLVDCLEQGTQGSHSPFLWAASRDGEGFPFCWKVELFGSLTHTQSQGLGIQRQLRAGIDVIGVTAPLSKHRQCISLQKCFENWMSLEFSVHKTIWNEERREETSCSNMAQDRVLTGTFLVRVCQPAGVHSTWRSGNLLDLRPEIKRKTNQPTNQNNQHHRCSKNQLIF